MIRLLCLVLLTASAASAQSPAAAATPEDTLTSPPVCGGGPESPPPSADWPDLFEVVEQQPELIGGIAALQSAIVYPRQARDVGIQGRVFVQFVVNECGEVTDPVIMRSPNDLLSQAALAAVSAQRFTPGFHRGRPVKVRYSLPINFVLADDELATPSPAATPADIIWEADDVDRVPEVIGGLQSLQARIVYPRMLRENRIQGEVMISFIVDTDGQVVDAEVLSSPHSGLSRAALDALDGSRWSPAKVDGRSVAARMEMPLTFRLR